MNGANSSPRVAEQVGRSSIDPQNNRKCWQTLGHDRQHNRRSDHLRYPLSQVRRSRVWWNPAYRRLTVKPWSDAMTVEKSLPFATKLMRHTRLLTLTALPFERALHS
jgi:hypothetical protein